MSYEIYLVKLSLAIVVIFTFTLWYSYLGSKKNHFNTSLNLLDAFYFSTTSFTAIGYGDIVPVSSTAKLSISLQTFLFFCIVIF